MMGSELTARKKSNFKPQASNLAETARILTGFPEQTQYLGL